MQCTFVEVRPDIWTCSNPGCEKVREVRFHNKDGKPPFRVCGKVAPPAEPKEFDPRDHERQLLEALPPCQHRGVVAVRNNICKLCGAKGEQFDVYQCDVYGKCSLGKREHGLHSCAGCRELKTDPLFPISLPHPQPSESLTPIPATISDVRNLLYHIYPTKASDNWRWNVSQLRQRLPLLNGVRSIGVVTDDATWDLETVKAEFAGERIDHWIERPNDPKNREGVTFIDLMNTLPRDDSVTVYAHAKGVRHSPESPAIRWAALLYQATFDHWGNASDALQRFPLAGAFKRYGEFGYATNHHWHYSGAFYWFRNRDTFRREWTRLRRNFFACVEAWPANIYRATEAACLFGDNAADLYQEHELSKWEQAWKSREHR